MIWPKEKPFEGAGIDGDNPQHLDWIYQRSAKRASEFGIEGVTMRLTQGVVKRIIPAVASTNAVIAAAFHWVLVIYTEVISYLLLSSVFGHIIA